MTRFLVIVLLSFSTLSVLAQGGLEIRLHNVKQGQPVLDYLQEVEQTGNLRFFYRSEWLENFSMQGEFEGRTLRDALQMALRESEISFVFLYDYAVIFVKDPSRQLARMAVMKKASQNKIKIDHRVIGNHKEFIPGKKVELKGTVIDERTDLPLSTASIYVNGLEIGTTTDMKGGYQIVLPEGEYVINFKLINYQERLINLSIYTDGQLNVILQEAPTMLEEVVVLGQNTSIVDKRIGQVNLKMSELKRAPSLLGQVDILKQVQTQPGVTTVSEATSGFNVRGGGVDQNLVLFDGVPIFNTAHALGFFSAFNSDAVSEASFYKGGIPAEFGGRVSSVLNMAAKEGSYDRWTATGGIGMVSGNLTVGGPIKHDTSSLIISLRSSYTDWILHYLKSRYHGINKGSIFFYDGSIKYSHKFNNQSKLTFSSYTSSDRFSLSNDTTNQWHNLTFSLRYDHTAKKNLFYSLGLYFGQYGYRVGDDDSKSAFHLDYKITYPTLKLDFNHEGNRHKQSFGFQSTYYVFSPGQLRPTSSESSIKAITIPIEHSAESAVYFSDSFAWLKRLQIEAGLRLTLFNRIGPGTLYGYEKNKAFTARSITDSTEYGTGQIMKSYFGPEPRLSFRYSVNSQSSIKLGYNRIYQYVHLITNSASITPVDIWQSSNAYFRPQIADQISLGFFASSRNNMFEGFIEGYYKVIQNILDFKNGANLILNRHLETDLLPGTGRAYGIEFSINKTKGKLVGGINYTYARSFRTVNGIFPEEKVNLGKEYRSSYDQPNIVNVNLRYNLVRRLLVSGAFTYHTGRPVSLPVSGYAVGSIPISDFSDRNNFRIPDYHRLDIAFILEGNYTKKKLKGTWVFSIYNVYGRKNPYSVFFLNNGNRYLVPYQLSIIGSAVPSIGYSFKF